MLALSGDSILLGNDAELGPIDPQMQFVTEQRPVSTPARAAIDQFERAADDILANPARMRVWLPILRQYGPSFLQECQNAIELSEALVSSWLTKYMFKGVPDGETRAERVAHWLADHNNFKAHSRPVWPEQLLTVEPGLNIRRLREEDQEFAAAVMDVYWAIDVTFGGTAAIKMIEHQDGSAYIKLSGAAIVGGPIPQQQPVPARPSGPNPTRQLPNPALVPNRAARRSRNKNKGRGR